MERQPSDESVKPLDYLNNLDLDLIYEDQLEEIRARIAQDINYLEAELDKIKSNEKYYDDFSLLAEATKLDETIKLAKLKLEELKNETEIKLPKKAEITE